MITHKSLEKRNFRSRYTQFNCIIHAQPLKRQFNKTFAKRNRKKNYLNERFLEFWITWFHTNDSIELCCTRTKIFLLQWVVVLLSVKEKAKQFKGTIHRGQAKQKLFKKHISHERSFSVKLDLCRFPLGESFR